MRRRSAVLSAASLALAFSLGACASEPDTPSPAEQTSSASSSAAAIEPAPNVDTLSITVTGEVNPLVKPTVQITTPLTVTETSRKIIAAGKGDEVKASDSVQFAYTLYAGSTGEELDTSYGKSDARFNLAEVTKGIAKGMVGAHVGDRLAVAIAPADGFGDAATQFKKEGVDATTTFVLVADIIRIIPTMAQGSPVTPPANLPTVTLDDKGVPTGFTVSDPTAPAATIAQPLIQGSGPVITSGMTVSMQYVGATLADGKVFETSWTGTAPFSTAIGTGQVIPGWDKGLVGQTVGSRVLLVIPAADAYGDEPTGGQPAGALVFVVDILDAY
ncbi:MAG: FKBP-type peptidyl-prolyl cis-trans isomerase [Janthinobacterium lividum]